jgi:major membrane immunogen (membrane-anchored lipoprotein)
MLGSNKTNLGKDTSMASVVKRGKSVAVVYYYQDENGKTKQKWDTVKDSEASTTTVTTDKSGRQKISAKKAIANEPAQLTSR